jgi:hypothetical protein
MSSGLPYVFTDKAVTAWGGLRLMQGFLTRLHFRAMLATSPLPQPLSNRGYSPGLMVESFLVAVWVGGVHFAHTALVRFDAALCEIFGWAQVASVATFTRFFRRFRQSTNQAVSSHWAHWLWQQVAPTTLTLDLDSSVPFVNVVRDQTEIAVVNMDPIEHDIQGYETARTRGARVFFNRPLPMNPFHKVAGLFGHQHLAGEPMVESIHLRKGRSVFVMQCGFHPYMFSWGLIVENPYFDMTKEDGQFEISDIPPGEYTLAAWHSGVNTFIEQSVVVKANQSISVQLAFESPQGGEVSMRWLRIPDLD